MEHSCVIISKSDPWFQRRRFFKNFCMSVKCNFANKFVKRHPRNIPVKLFQNQMSCFREEIFVRISSCPYSASSPHSPEPYFWMDQNFAKSFKKGHPSFRNILMKVFQNQTNRFTYEDF